MHSLCRSRASIVPLRDSTSGGVYLLLIPCSYLSKRLCLGSSAIGSFNPQIPLLSRGAEQKALQKTWFSSSLFILSFSSSPLDVTKDLDPVHYTDQYAYQLLMLFSSLV